MKHPPTTITIKHCNECGRNDLVRPFTGKSHNFRGERCPGRPRKVTYRIKP